MWRHPLTWALLISLGIHLLILLGSHAQQNQPVTSLQAVSIQLQKMQLEPASATDNAKAETTPADTLQFFSGRRHHKKPAGPLPSTITPQAVARVGKSNASAPARQTIASAPAGMASAPVQTRRQVASAPQARPASAPLTVLAMITASAPVKQQASAPEPATENDDASSPTADKIQAVKEGHHRLKPGKPGFPQQAEVKYNIYYGSLIAGTATITWQRRGEHYRLESRIVPIIGPVLRYRSTGQISNIGLKPEHYSAWRNDAPRESAQFDWQKQSLLYGDETRQEIALQPGAQDIFSLIYQLALKGADRGAIQITTGKKVYQYPLAPAGEADLKTDNGTIRALVFRAVGDDDQTEFWLAPAFANQPVRIIRTDRRMRLDMRATNITIDHRVDWQQAQPQIRKNNR